MRKSFFVIFNPHAGTSRRAAIEAVVQELEAGGAQVDWARATTEFSARTEAAEAARSGAYDALVAAGGDGTIRQAAAAAAGGPTPLGFVALGTGNVLAHEVAMPRRAPEIAHVLAFGPTAPVDLALANGEPFLLMAGAGFDGRIIQGLNHRLKNRIAKAAYVPPVIATLNRPLDALQVTVDGKPFEAAWVVVSNSERYGGAFRLAPRTHITKPGLQAVLFRARSKPHLIRQALALALGRLEGRVRPGGDVDMLTCETVHIAAATPVPTQIDGDAFASTPLTVTRGGGTVQLIVPGER